jgi:hypothetical protein
VRIRSHPVTCADCGARWPARARYCGRCGAVVTPPPAHGPRGHTRSQARPGPPRAVRGGTVGVLVVAVVAVVVLGSGPGVGTATSPLDDEVALPSARSVPPATGATLADDVTAQADDAPGAASARTGTRPDRADLVLTRSSPGVPRTVTCVPAGCHGWRRPFDRERPPTVGAGGGLVVVVDADRATGVDAATGQERWVAPLDDLLPTTAGGTRLSDLVGRERPHLAVDDDLVLIGTGRRVAALDPSDGERRWVARSTGWRLEALTVLDRVVVLRERPRPIDEEDEAGRPRRVQPITVLDRADGTVRWRTEVAELVDVDADGGSDGRSDGSGGDGGGSDGGDDDGEGGGLTVIVDDRLQGVDPTTGYVRWRRSWSAGAYVFRAGPWLVTEGSRGHRLLDPATGRELADLDGYLAHGVLEVGELTVSVLLQPEPGAAPTSHAGDLVALAADGTTVWRQPYGFAAPMRCCATLLPWEGGLAVLGLRGERELRDLATGDRRQETAHLPLDGPVRIAADGTLVGEPVGDLVGVPALTTVAPDGQVTDVAGPELTIVGTDPLVVRGSGELVGVHTARGE